MDILADAQKATLVEHEMGLLQSLKVYRKGALWSLALSTAIIMEGFDLILINSLFGFPSFQRKFGVLQPDGTYDLTAAWQTGLANGVLVGQIVGLFINGIVADRYGYRKTMATALVGVVAFIFIIFFAPNIQTLLVGEILIGIPFGIFQATACTYASEVCPTQLRAYLTTYINLCWVIGQIIASGVLKALVDKTDEWGYRIPFALQWIWPVPILIAVALAPESPWWLARHGRIQDARKSVVRLTNTSAHPNFNVDHAVAMMVYTDNVEKAVSAGTHYTDCFKGTDLRRTEIVCGAWACQVLCGSAFSGYSSYFFQQAGLDASDSFSLTLGQYCIGAVGVFTSWFLMGWFGRRTLYLYGLAAMAVFLAIIGFVGLAGRSNTGAQWSIGAMILIFTFVYDSTVGPICYAVVSEIPSTRLKTKSVALARNSYNITGIVNNIITPRMLNPTAWNWGAKSGFFWAGSCVLCFVWAYFRLPEPKGRTYSELDILFETKISARKFKSAAVDGFSGNGREHRDTSPLGKVEGVEAEKIS
ncbi:general substrate transporter [Truncatella angustata]|uniref:General substrate transporter n=1 Tax=Truncatella angustata TaxID=152316 RepID=A0A9P8UZR6_9PEZI|nr:general substrate transporter [Truncatella angustata]KAH6660839.1 general substrate transporter [Truncatella angustata]